MVPVTVVEGAPTFEEYLNTVAIPHGDGWIVERDIYVSSMDAIRLIYETAFADTSARFQDSITSRSTIGSLTLTCLKYPSSRRSSGTHLATTGKRYYGTISKGC